ncbi:MAG: beta-ketoacyl-[acyl-carrier-protein] synthase family protein [Verrucomicrobia bacterium]|nr:MAG: beta-ketoacyl-[acyl-carrier-protein] synthase family protein [Verrucomicrobiota bacterium]
MLFPPRNSCCEPRRVVVTGAGIITALGRGWRANAEGFRLGRTGFRPVSRFDVSRQRVKVAAEADLPEPMPRRLLSERQVERLDNAGKLLLVAAFEAWEQAGWDRSENLPIVLGTTAAGMALGEDFFRLAVRTPEQRERQAARALFYQAQTQVRALAEALGCRGPLTILSTACAAGANAVGHAWELVRFGRAERVLSGGYEAVTQLLFCGFDSLQALSPTACRPFDAGRDGLALGEGAAVLALESLESARRRGAAILGEVIGYGTTTDLHHLTQPQPQGDAALAAMTLACERAEVTPSQIDYVNAHGTGTPLNDSAEALAIQRWAGSRANTLPVSSTKASIGHLLGAAGAVEAVVCLMALREQFLPPELAFEAPDPACVFPVVRKPASAQLQLALSNSFGFGGVNASLIFRRWCAEGTNQRS